MSACAECWACGQLRPLIDVGPAFADLIDGLEPHDLICQLCVSRAVDAAGVAIIEDLDRLIRE